MKRPRRVNSHVLEQVIFLLMFFFSFLGLGIVVKSIEVRLPFDEFMILFMLIIIIIAMLAQTILMIRVYQAREQ